MAWVFSEAKQGETWGEKERRQTVSEFVLHQFVLLCVGTLWGSMVSFLWRQLEREICRGVPVGGRPKVRNRGGWVDVGKTKGVARSGAEREDGKGGQNGQRGRRREAPRWKAHNYAIHLATLT